MDSMTLTAAELVRQSQKRQRREAALPKPPPPMQSTSCVDLDEEIRRLEQELANDDDEDDDSLNDDDASHDNDSHTEAQAQILSLSKSKEATIAHLPPSLLPTIPTRKQRGNSNNMSSKGTALDSAKRSKTEPNAKQPKAKSNPGLEAAVRQVLQGYQARSAERLPFYCRVCARQFDDATSWEAHKLDEFHVTAVALERQASTCKLCRQTFTSPTQLTEHLQSKPHRERLQRVQQKQSHHHGPNSAGQHRNTTTPSSRRSDHRPKRQRKL
jgi:Zinc-finger of C2H2 type